MAWTKLVKPAFILGDFVRGFLHGSLDEAKMTFTDAEISRFSDTAEMLKRCEPSEIHLYRDAYGEINKAIKQNDYKAARKAVTQYSTETADPSCITVLKTALIEVCTKCTTLLRESLPDRIVTPK